MRNCKDDNIIKTCRKAWIKLKTELSLFWNLVTLQIASSSLQSYVAAARVACTESGLDKKTSFYKPTVASETSSNTSKRCKTSNGKTSILNAASKQCPTNRKNVRNVTSWKIYFKPQDSEKNIINKICVMDLGTTRPKQLKKRKSGRWQRRTQLWYRFDTGNKPHAQKWVYKCKKWCSTDGQQCKCWKY